MDEAPGSVKSANWWQADDYSGKDCQWCQDNCWRMSRLPTSEAAYRDICKAIDVWAKHLDSDHGRKKKHGNGAPSGAFAFTLTKSPKDPHTVSDMLAAVRKIVSQKTRPVVKYAWYYEDKGRDDDGNPIHPHIHGMYQTDTLGRIPFRQFKRAWSIWDEEDPIGKGFRGGYHRAVRNDEKYRDYIKKDGNMGESLGLDDEETE